MSDISLPPPIHSFTYLSHMLLSSSFRVTFIHSFLSSFLRFIIMHYFHIDIYCYIFSYIIVFRLSLLLLSLPSIIFHYFIFLHYHIPLILLILLSSLYSFSSFICFDIFSFETFDIIARHIQTERWAEPFFEFREHEYRHYLFDIFIIIYMTVFDAVFIIAAMLHFIHIIIFFFRLPLHSPVLRYYWETWSLLHATCHYLLRAFQVALLPVMVT